jgi:CDP-diacylglycerol--glycerol-3-phosphate 3-phosphatidyltransferase
MNLPNILSVIRLCLVPAFILTFFSGSVHAELYAAIVYAVATVTDFLDGFLARRLNQITNLGKVLDPLGDKMFLFAVLGCLTIKKIIPVWVLIIFVVKEASMGIGGLLIHRSAKVEIPPSNYVGKTATVLFFVICVALLLFPSIPRRAAIAMICLCLAVSLAAFVTYIKSFLAIMRDRKKIQVTGE